VATVANDVFENIPEHFVFVLDDYHLIDDSRPVSQFVSRFLQVVGENCHLFIASRTLLTLPDLPLLVARDEVGGLGVDELSFKPDDIQALYLQNQRQVLPTAMARDLFNRTEGWITGVLLTSQISGGGLPVRKGALKAAGVDLYGYLAQQVLEKQPAALQEFLLRSSLFEEFNASFCAEVIGPALGVDLDWEELMDAALRSNLFILSVDEESVWLRYHHLFLEFLRQRVLKQRPREAELIQTRLAQVYAARGQWELAYRVYQRLGRISAQASLVEQAAGDMMTSGKLNTLDGWLETMPEETRLARPILLSLQGALAVMRGELLQGEALFDQAIDGLRASGERYHLAVALSRRAIELRMRGQYDQALIDADEAVQVAAELGGQNRAPAEAMRARGMVLLSMGEIRPAFESLTQAYTAFQTLGDTTGAARLLIEIGMARRRLGQLDEAEIAYIQALELWEATRNLLWQANTLNNLGVLQHDRGDYLAAIHSLERAVECARLAGYPRMEAFALAGLGDLFRDLDAFNESTEAYRQGVVLAGRVGEQSLVFYLDLARGVLARHQQQFVMARDFFYAAAARVENGLSQVEQAACDLELATLALLQNQPERVPEILTLATRLYASQSARMENARVQLLLMLSAAVREDWAAARIHRQQFMEIWDSPAAWPPLVAIARELQPWLEHFHHRAELEPLAGRLLRQADSLGQRLPGLRRQLRPQAGVVPLGPAQVVVKAFGRMEVRYNHRLVTNSDWRSLVARDLFFFMLDHPQGLSKEQIGLVFWPDASPDQLQQRFRNLIYRLRHAVGSDAVVLSPDETYRFNANLDYEYDVETFERELAMAKSAAPEARLQHLLCAVRLVQGPYLPDLGAEWALVARQRLLRLHLDALTDAANLALVELNRAEQALQLCQQALEVDPSMEEIHRLAMRCFAAEGDRAGLIRQYNTCCQALQEEFAALPSPQTTRLFEELSR